jgi:plastocyanin
MRLHRSRLVVAALVATALLPACGDDDETAADTADHTPAEGTDVVTIEGSSFLPDELTVAAGSEVTWENRDPFAHTVTSAEGSAVAFDSGELDEGDTFAQTFDEAGTFDYVCEIHPSMKSTVVVE